MWGWGVYLGPSVGCVNVSALWNTLSYAVTTELQLLLLEMSWLSKETFPWVLPSPVYQYTLFVDFTFFSDCCTALYGQSHSEVQYTAVTDWYFWYMYILVITSYLFVGFKVPPVIYRLDTTFSFLLSGLMTLCTFYMFINHLRRQLSNTS